MENFFTTRYECPSINNNNKINNSEKEFFELLNGLIEPGNIVPNFWYKTITDKKGRPDLGAITLLSEILALYRLIPKDKFPIGSFMDVDHQPILIGKSIRTSNDYFANKFGFSKDIVRRGLIFLEKLNIIKRNVVNVALKKGRRGNKILITIKAEFFKSCFRDPKTDIRAQKNEYTSTNTNKENDVDNNKIQSSENSSDHISNNNFFNNRSISTYKKNDISKKVLKLSDFTDPTEKDCDTLRRLSGRQFSSNAIKEIIKDMARKLSHICFTYKSGFIAYMVQALKHEKRDEVKTSKNNFRIKANLTDEDKKAIEIERYLTEVENIREVSQEVHLKKKLASVLSPITAYNLLRNYRDIKMVGSIAQIKLGEHVELTELEKEIVLAQVKATHERVGECGTILWIEDIRFVMPPKRKAKNEDNKITVSSRTGIWGNIRTTIAKYLSYGSSNGDAIDASWFSKLEAEIDAQTKQIKLKAPSNFIKDYVFREYENVIDQASMYHGFMFEGIYSEENPKEMLKVWRKQEDLYS